MSGVNDPILVALLVAEGSQLRSCLETDGHVKLIIQTQGTW